MQACCILSADARERGAGPRRDICKYHLAWCPRCRRRVLVRGRLKAILGAAEREAQVMELEVMSDHGIRTTGAPLWLSRMRDRSCNERRESSTSRGLRENDRQADA